LNEYSRFDGWRLIQCPLLDVKSSIYHLSLTNISCRILRRFVIEIYVEDLWSYYLPETTKSATGKHIITTFPETQYWEVSFDAKIHSTVTSSSIRFGVYPTGNGNPQLSFLINSVGFGIIYGTTGSTSDSAEASRLIDGITFPVNTYVPLKIVKKQGVAEFYYDGNLVTTQEYSWNNSLFKVHISKWNNVTASIKNIKIKKL
jgi:hypothetical protein